MLIVVSNFSVEYMGYGQRLQVNDSCSHVFATDQPSIWDDTVRTDTQAAEVTNLVFWLYRLTAASAVC